MYKTASEIADRVLEKVAGYYQNVVGFDDAEKFKQQRAAMLEEQKQYEAMGANAETYKDQASKQKYWDAQKKLYAAKDRFGTDIGGTDLGLLGKYTELPELYGPGELQGAWGSSSDLGDGYLSKEDLLNSYVFTDERNTFAPKELRDAIRNSKHKYFTSTRAS